MGMDVIGRDPKNEAGDYFRANVWSWRPINHLMIDLCSDFLDEEVLRAMSFNDGAGPEDQATCNKIADRFDAWMERHTEGHTLESDLRVGPGGRLLSLETVQQNPTAGVSPYLVHDEHLKEWVEFLRSCGGFQVY
jgi:hypothetical protein